MSDDEEPVVELAIEDWLDLHGFQPRDIPDVVESYLEAAREKGFEEVRLVHGRGKGIQRKRTQARLAQLDYVLGFSDAPHWRGGWGATIVRLRRLDQD